MTNQPDNPLYDVDDAVRTRVLAHASAINGTLLARFATVSDDLDEGRHLAALGGLDGIEREISSLRSLLLLLT